MRKAAAVALALVVLAAGAVALVSDPWRDKGREAAGDLGLGADPPFAIRFSGPLWRDRTLRDAGGARDVAQVVRDEPLEVRVAGAGARIAEIELRVDGRPQRTIAVRCPSGTCPKRTTLTIAPALRRLAPGDHRIQVVARDARRAASSRTFRVRTVRSIPSVRESDPVGRAPAPPTAPIPDAARERAALAVLAQERRRAPLVAALGNVRLRVVEVGDLDRLGRRLGATLLVELVAPRRDVRATVPAFIPSPDGGGAPYTLQRVRIRVAVLRDALIDLDLGQRRLIAFEPGPGSRTTSWSPSKQPAPVGADDED
jgi:hypothetical protein